MITVTIQQNKNGNITSFQMDGHANFSVKGQDIVCAGASAISFGMINAVMELTNVEPIIEQKQDGGYLSCSFPDDLPKEIEDQVQLLLKGMVISLQTIERDYGEYITIHFQ